MSSDATDLPLDSDTLPTDLPFYALFRELVTRIPAVCYICKTDALWTALYVSPQIKQFGFSQSDWIRDPMLFQNAIHVDDRDTVMARAHELLSTKRTMEIEYRLNARDGRTFWVRDCASLVSQGDHELVHGILIDITKTRQAVQSLHDSHRDLEALVRERTADLAAERGVLQRIIDLQEEERCLVAHDIHDGFVQDVVGAYYHLQAIQERVMLPTITSQLDQTASMLQKAIAEARRLVRTLRPLMLDETGLIPALTQLFEDLEREAGLRVAFLHDLPFDQIGSRLGGTLFRIVQEALNNVKHHSQTDRASVTLNHKDGMILLSISDQGIGFDPMTVPMDRFGLKAIRERAVLFGGQAIIDSSTGNGTVIRVTVPLPRDSSSGS